MAEQRIVVVSEVTLEPIELTLQEMADACHVIPAFIVDLVAEGALDPIKGKTPDQWRFDINQLRRVRTAIRLHHDLEINFAGAALVMELMDELDQMRMQLELLERLHR